MTPGEKWNLVFDGFTAFGTVGAVIIALWLGFKEHRLRIRISLHTGLYRVSGEEDAYVTLQLVNDDIRNLRLEGIYLTKSLVGGVRQSMVPQLYHDEYNNQSHEIEFPLILTPDNDYDFEIDNFFTEFEGSKSLLEIIQRAPSPRFQSWALRIIVVINDSEFKIRLSKGSRKVLLRHIEVLKAAKDKAAAIPETVTPPK